MAVQVASHRSGGGGWRGWAVLGALAVGLAACVEAPGARSNKYGYWGADDHCHLYGLGSASPLSCKDVCPWDRQLQDFLTCYYRTPDGVCQGSLADLVPGCIGGLCVCQALDYVHCTLCTDGHALFSRLARKFDRVHVVSTFPAAVDPAKGTSERVCGAPLAGEVVKQANGLEFTLEMVSTDLDYTAAACKGDKDTGFRDGERAEGIPLSTKVNQGATVTPAMFHLQADCIEPRDGTGDPAQCASQLAGMTLSGQTVHYAQNAPRCDPTQSNTWQNVVILVDHSGSTSGQVVIDSQSCLDATKFAEDLPEATKAPEQYGKCSSDKYSIRVQAAHLMINQLNAQDRVMTMYFDERDGVGVGCTDSMRCRRDDGTGKFEEQPSMKGKVCNSDEDCDAMNSYSCDAALSSASPDGYDLDDIGTKMNKCFGASAQHKAMNRYGINARTRYNGNGRAPVYEAVHSAFQFLNTHVAPPDPVTGGNAKHIVLIADGPDTCMPSDDFYFSDPKAEFAGKQGQCRTPCAASTVSYQALLAEMSAAKWPVVVHVVQLQSHGQSEPNAELIELACRSGGTYQFVSQVDFHQDDPGESYKAIGTAVAGVRQALGGTWRAGFVLPSVNPASPPPAVPIGTTLALRGELRFENPKFIGLASIYKPYQYSAEEDLDHQFRQSGADHLRDRRLMFRAACSSDADCGGTDPCAPNHCGPGGVCRTSPAPDLRPCGDGKVCCGGVCSASCAKVCSP